MVETTTAGRLAALAVLNAGEGLARLANEVLAGREIGPAMADAKRSFLKAAANCDGEFWYPPVDPQHALVEKKL